MVDDLDPGLEQWRRWASVVADRRGRGLDALIVDTVIGFNVAGFPTSGSCQGHTSSGAWWPWVDIGWAESLPITLRPLLNSLKADTGFDIKGERLTAETLRLSPREAPSEDQWLHQMPAAEPDRLSEWQSYLPDVAAWLNGRARTPPPLPPDLSGAR